MTTALDVPANQLISRVAKELEVKPEFTAPTWARFVKTGTSRERPPQQKDWWHLRTAAILRTIYIQGPVGTNRLRVKYGGLKNMGYGPSRPKKGSGSIARKILQQLEKAGYVKQGQKGTHKGRIITPAGKKLMDKAATEVHGKKVSA